MSAVEKQLKYNIKENKKGGLFGVVVGKNIAVHKELFAEE